MTKPQERVAVLTAFAVLILVTAMLLVILIAMTGGTLAGDRFPGSTYLTVMRNARDIGLIFASLLTVVTAGTYILARSSTKPWVLYASSALCLLGLGMCLWLFLGMQDGDVAYPLWSVSEPIIKYDQLQSGNRLLLGLTAGWLGTFLATQLGIVYSRGGDAGRPPNTGRHPLPPDPAGSADEAEHAALPPG